jgi:hypothetical protein
VAEQVLDFGLGFPASQENDTTTELSLGLRFTISENAPCVGVEVLAPLILPSGPSPARAAIWDADDPSDALDIATFDWSTLTPGEWNRIYLDGGPLALVTTKIYVASYQTYERWAGTNGYSLPLTTGIITALSPNGYAKVGLPYGYPANVNAYTFGVSPVMDVTSAVEATVDAVMPAMTATGEASLTVSAQADGTTPALTAAVAASQTITATVSATMPATTAVITTVDTDVHPPSTGTVTRPDDGVVAVPRIGYP